MLDANVVVHLANYSDGFENIVSKLAQIPLGQLCISSVAFFELYSMLEKGVGKIKKQNIERLREAMESIRVVPYTKQDATLGGLIDAGLEKTGKRIGAKDAMIAGHCAMRGLTLVTDNTREFERVEGLVIENWRKI